MAVEHDPVNGGKTAAVPTSGLRRAGEAVPYDQPRAVQELIDRAERLMLSQPAAAISVAQEAVDLARALRGATPGAQAGLVAKALATLASATSAAGQGADAVEVYREILEIADEIPRLELAAVLRRYAVALRRLGAHAEALALVNRALAIHAELRSGVGLALVIRGGIHLEHGAFDAAAEDLAGAMPLLSPKSDQRYYYSALAGLAVCAVRSPNPAGVGAMLKKLRKARRSAGLPLWSVPALKFMWIEGLLLRRLGSTRAAEKSLCQARNGLLEIGLLSDVALLTLDLVDLMMEDGRETEATEMVAEVIALAAAGGTSLETALGALRLFVAEPKAKILQAARAALLNRPVRAEP